MPQPKRPDSRVLDLRTRTAFHEAGHVVASLALGRKVRNVTIVPEGDHLGSVQNSRLRRLDPAATDRRLRATIEREAMILLAGRAAEQIVGCGPHGGRLDRCLSLSLARFLSGSADEEKAYVRWLQQRIRTVLLVHWQAVEAIAKALLEREQLDGADVRRIAGEADSTLLR